MHHRRRRRIFRQCAHARSGKPERSRFARRRIARAGRQAQRARLTLPIFRPKASPPWCSRRIDLAEITTEDPHRRSAGRRRTGRIPGRSAALFDRRRAPWRPSGKSRRRKRAEEAALSRRSAHHQLRRRVVRFLHRPPHFRQFARIRRQLPRQLLLASASSPVAQQNGSMERDYWYHLGARGSRLESPE